jgi:hypothetical protein
VLKLRLVFPLPPIPSHSPRYSLPTLTSYFLVQLKSGNLAVFSPVALTPTAKATVTSLGDRVAYIAAPDIEHHIFLSAWAAAYPNAHIIAPEGLAEKRATMNKSNKEVTILSFGTIFTKAEKNSTEGIKVSEEFDSEFETEFVEMHPNKELAFFHKPTKTLINADLMFNLPAQEAFSKSGIDPTTGWSTKLFTALTNTKGNAIWQKRLQWYAFSKADRPGFNKSIQRINSWGPENIVMCHGDTIVGDGKGIFQKVFQWHLDGQKT